MKRVFFVVLMLMSSAAFGYIGGEAEDIYTFPIYNPSPNPLTTVISTDIIRPTTDKIVGFGVQPHHGYLISENIIALYDETSGLLSGEMMGETETLRDEGITEFFPMPRRISNGAVVRQGAYTTAIIYFIRR